MIADTLSTAGWVCPLPMLGAELPHPYHPGQDDLIVPLFLILLVGYPLVLAIMWLGDKVATWCDSLRVGVERGKPWIEFGYNDTELWLTNRGQARVSWIATSVEDDVIERRPATVICCGDHLSLAEIAWPNRRQEIVLRAGADDFHLPLSGDLTAVFRIDVFLRQETGKIWVIENLVTVRAGGVQLNVSIATDNVRRYSGSIRPSVIDSSPRRTRSINSKEGVRGVHPEVNPSLAESGILDHDALDDIKLMSMAELDKLIHDAATAPCLRERASAELFRREQR
jgi:hypothetical protein